MTDTVEWGDPILHDGSDECPEHARDVPCCVRAPFCQPFGTNGKFVGSYYYWSEIAEYCIPADHPFYAKGEQPAEEPTCGGCRWWDRYDSDFALPDQGRCHFNPATPDGFGLCFEDSMACSKFTAKGAGQ